MTAAEPQCVRFVLDGETVLAPPLPPTTTLLDYLREVAGRTGTKEGCAEGDCGACTVVLGRPRAGDDGIDWRAVNSCIRLLPTIDGCELVTVESLAAPDGELHPVQQALVDGHASQCGFCTPGFVMSLFAHYLQHETTTRESLIDALAGNLCRCTGYRPIIDAGVACFGLPVPQRWSRADAQAPPRLAALRGCPWRATGIEAAIAALATDFQPLDDLRASAGYRRRAAGNLLRRFQMESTARSLRTHDVSVQAASA